MRTFLSIRNIAFGLVLAFSTYSVPAFAAPRDLSDGDSSYQVDGEALEAIDEDLLRSLFEQEIVERLKDYLSEIFESRKLARDDDGDCRASLRFGPEGATEIKLKDGTRVKLTRDANGKVHITIISPSWLIPNIDYDLRCDGGGTCTLTDAFGTRLCSSKPSGANLSISCDSSLIGTGTILIGECRGGAGLCWETTHSDGSTSTDRNSVEGIRSRIIKETSPGLLPAIDWFPWLKDLFPHLFPICFDSIADSSEATNVD